MISKLAVVLAISVAICGCTRTSPSAESGVTQLADQPIQFQGSRSALARARQIISNDAQNILSPLSGASVGCRGTKMFLGSLDRMRPASTDGRLAAIYGCNQLIVLDAVDGRALQRAREDDYELPTIFVRAVEDNVIILALSRDPDGTFDRMDAKSSMAPTSVPWPKSIRNKLGFGVGGGRWSAEDGVGAIQFCSGDTGLCPLLTIYDLEQGKLVNEIANVPEFYRVLQSVERTGDGYTVHSQLRSEQPSGEWRRETLFVSGTGAGVEEFPAQLDQRRIPPPQPIDTTTCSLVDGVEQVGSYDFPRHVLAKIDGNTRIVLNDTKKSAVDDCAISLDGHVLLVIAGSELFRFAIDPAGSVLG